MDDPAIPVSDVPRELMHYRSRSAPNLLMDGFVRNFADVGVLFLIRHSCCGDDLGGRVGVNGLVVEENVGIEGLQDVALADAA